MPNRRLRWQTLEMGKSQINIISVPNHKFVAKQILILSQTVAFSNLNS